MSPKQPCFSGGSCIFRDPCIPGDHRKEHRSRTVVCPQASIFGDTPTEFREGREHHSLARSMASQVLLERPNRSPQFAQQRGVSPFLLGMRVETVQTDKVHPRGKFGHNHLSDQLQATG